MYRQFHSVVALCILIATSRDVFAAPINTGGVELIFAAVFLAPLLLLLLVGAGIGGRRGAAVGLAVYLCGLAVLFVYGIGSDAIRKYEHTKAGSAWSDACLREAGENGHILPFRAGKTFVVVDPRIRDFWWPLRFDEKRALPQIEFLPADPEELATDQVLVSIRLIDRAVEGAGNWRVQGFETTVSDSKRQIVAKRINFVRVSDSCLKEKEEVAIQRFLRRIVGTAPFPSNESSDEASEIPVAYPIAIVTGPEMGRFEVGKGIGVGAYTPPEWNCILERNVGGPALINCPGPDGKLIRDSGLQHRWFLHDLGQSWLVIGDPNLTNHVNNGFLDRVVVEERTRNGRPYRKWFVRFPSINETAGYAIGDVRMSSEQLELVWLFKWRKGAGTNEASGHYTERFVMIIPLRSSLVVAQPIIPPDAAR